MPKLLHNGFQPVSETEMMAVEGGGVALASHRDGYFGKPESFWECFNRKAFEYEKGLEKTCKKDTIKTAEQVGRL